MENWESKVTFLNDPNLETVAPGIYVYRNFLDEEQTIKMKNILDERAKNNWIPGDNILELIQDVEELFPIWEKMSKFLYPTHVIHPRLQATIIRPGDGGMYIHTDTPGEGGEEELTQFDMWSTCTSLDYGVITYFGEYEGGDVIYPEIDKKVSPKPGDLVIHNALLQHGVNEVTSGLRYAFSNFCLPIGKNPGSFYNFNSPEYLELIKQPDFLKTFEKPLKENIRGYKSIVDPEYDPETKTWKYEEGDKRGTVIK